MERGPKVDVGVNDVRVELDGFAVLGDGVVELPLALERASEVVVGGCVLLRASVDAWPASEGQH